MQILDHKNTTLTVCQRFFIEKSVELLYMGSIDSYRIKLHNPITILQELKYCLTEFDKGRIKHFHTIKGSHKSGKVIVDEVISLLSQDPSYIRYSSISKEYLTVLLNDLNEQNYKRLIPSIKMLLIDNENYIDDVFEGIETLINLNDCTFDSLRKIDISLNILFSSLIKKGFSKGFLYKLLYGVFVHSLTNCKNFENHFQNLRIRLTTESCLHKVIFRIDTTPKVYDAISQTQVAGIILTDNINSINLEGARSITELAGFNATLDIRKFIECEVEAFDYLSALKKARKQLSEYLDVINLGLSGEFLNIHNRVLVIDLRSPERGAFQNNTNILDGKYKAEQSHYRTFTNKIPSILNSNSIIDETKEKIKSAVRYLRLGNESTEIEHKFINYWIGLEYLFSNYESNNTIERLKKHFINAHTIAYTKRNIYSFKKNFSQLSDLDKAKATTYTNIDDEFLKDKQFYEEVSTELLDDYPLLSYRAMKLKDWFFKSNSKPANATDYLNRHKENLEIHFTRIYRLRNEIIHDAAMNTNNQLIVSNLRYYLTFILNEMIDYLSNADMNGCSSIEDYFISNELKLGNIQHQGYRLIDLLDVDCVIDFIT